MRFISGTKLKGDIFDYRRLKSRKIDLKLDEVIKRSGLILDQYADGLLDVHDRDKKVLAEYIDTFADSNRREHLLTKLQKETLFDVKQYLSDDKRSYWQKFLNIEPNAGHISASGLERRIRKYNRLNRKLSEGWYHRERDYQAQRVLESEAERYASGFLKGEVEVTRAEVPALKNYLMTFQNQINATSITDAYNEVLNTPVENFAEKRTPLWQRFKKSVKNTWNEMVDAFKPKRAMTINMDRKSWYKVAAASVLFAVGASYFLKSDTASSKTVQKPAKAIKQKTSASTEQTSIKTDAFAEIKPELTHEQKIWKNFYDTKNAIQANDAGIDLQAMYKNIEAQQEAGIFVMPENISVERFAFTHLMYKAHGLNSPLEAAINGKQKISAEQQKAIAEAIQIADTNGAGVKRLAFSISKRMGRELSNHSAYDHASKEMKQQYINNIRAVKSLNQH